MRIPRCLCGHLWSEHRAGRLPGSTVPTCTITSCQCDDWLECVANHEAKRHPGHADWKVAKGSQWSVFTVEGDRVLLESEHATITVKDPELHLFFHQLGAM